MTKVEDEHLKKCKAEHFRTRPFEGAENKLLVCEKTGQYVDRQALRDEIERFYERKYSIGA
jgi:hypothetical protein